MAKGKSSKQAQEPSGLPDEKHAVIVFHGMGEQRPMDTLRAFVSSLVRYRDKQERAKPNLFDQFWQRMSGAQGTAESDLFWIVPDGKTGSHELARIRTRPRHLSGLSEQTDFFEFYYADLLTGNTYKQFASWAWGLLFRRLDQIPKHQFWFWVLLWCALFFIIAAVGTEFMNSPLDRISDAWNKAYNIRSFLTLAISGLLAVGSFLWLLPRLFPGKAEGGPAVGGALDKVIAERNVASALNIVILVLLPVGIGAFAYFLFPWSFFGIPEDAWTAYRSTGFWPWAAILLLWNWPTFKLLVALGVYSALQWFLIPYFGDVGRYVSTKPDAVATRNEIRERGLKLLETLHDSRRDGSSDGAPEYARIIIIAHSLGSVIALDVLRLFWARRANAIAEHLATRSDQKKISDLDAYCRDHIDAVSGQAKKGFDRHEFSRLQADAMGALLSRQDSPYRVVDFITMGSPLAHADFLVARDLKRFIAAVHERVLPRCPPFQEFVERRDERSFLYKINGLLRPHHAALFAFTRWSAFYDPRQIIVMGDLVGGPLQPNFGAGINDIPVKMYRGGGFRFVTHTLYWNDSVTGRFVSPQTLPAELTDVSASDVAHIAGMSRLIWTPPPEPKPGAGAGKPVASKN